MNTTVLLGTLWPIGNAKEPEKKEHDPSRPRRISSLGLNDKSLLFVRVLP